MIEYPSIINSARAPREACAAFEKYDGSNIRAKWTRKNGFETFGTRTTLMDETHPHLGDAVKIFKADYAEGLDKLFKKQFPNEREIVCFGEYFGEHSYAGIHDLNEPHELVLFDVLVGHKNQKFLRPKDFVKLLDGYAKIAKVVCEGNLNEELIADVRANKFNLKEGVICKGSTVKGQYRGGIWMCKIKTQAYLDSLKERFKDEWVKYAE